MGIEVFKGFSTFSVFTSSGLINCDESSQNLSESPMNQGFSNSKVTMGADEVRVLHDIFDNMVFDV